MELDIKLLSLREAAVSGGGGLGLPPIDPKSEKRKKEETMAEQGNEKAEVRAMWIMVAVVVLIILAGTGWHMWTHPDWMHGG